MVYPNKLIQRESLLLVYRHLTCQVITTCSRKCALVTTEKAQIHIVIKLIFNNNPSDPPPFKSMHSFFKCVV